MTANSDPYGAAQASLHRLSFVRHCYSGLRRQNVAVEKSVASRRTKTKREEKNCENQSDWLLAGNFIARVWRPVWRRGGVVSPARKRRGHGAPWLSLVLHHDHRLLEGAWEHSPTRAGFPEAQGMGVCRSFFQHDGRGRIARGTW